MNTLHDMALVRVERGVAGEEELAALTALLLARAAAAHDDTRAAAARRPRSTARWNRLERHRPYRSPLSWQAPA
ncbi:MULTISPECIES: acyl-CoA carboxylase epsilon subunit [unclassified Streptomyces]|uniref:acyl-CoA carboxylase epsilon subunit n=1 Tax=unclassified Streptomyces TaxID=2593676 RepID=UPI004042F095